MENRQVIIKNGGQNWQLEQGNICVGIVAERNAINDDGEYIVCEQNILSEHEEYTCQHSG